MAMIANILPEEEYLNRAFGRASKRASIVQGENKVWVAKEKEAIRIGFASDILSEDLAQIVKTTFSYEKVTPFYRELLPTLIDIDRFKKALGGVQWASREVSGLKRRYLGRLRNVKMTNEARDIRIEYYGIASATLNKIRKDLAYLREASQKLETMPKLKDLPTVVIAGLPNVGKSSLMARLTGASPEIQPYPFTTKGLLLGYKRGKYDRVQFIDTPGLLDRPIHERNAIEKRAVAALKHVAKVVVYVYDISESCGYSVKEQENLLKELNAQFKKPVIEVYNKADIAAPKEGLTVSTKTGEGVDALWEKIIEKV